MRKSAHSRTAEITAAIRAGHYLYDDPLVFSDPYALALTSGLWRTIFGSRWLHHFVIRRLLSSLRPVHGWILCRDLVTDLVVEAYIRSGGGQFVVLGAGFDTSVLRRPQWLSSLNIVEVDHPATQAVKIERMARLGAPLPANNFSRIAIDFETESLADCLARPEFQGHRSTLFAWQGVIYYLSTEAIKDTLTAISSSTPPGSELLFDFLMPDNSLSPENGRAKFLAGMITARLGERYISFHTEQSITALLNECGFDVITITLDEELQQTHLGERTDGLTAMRGFGIAHARVRG
jgi:methyltransferase (TIGR00027 family)